MKEPLILSPRGQMQVEVRSADSTSIDSFGRFRISEQFGVFDNKNILDRNRQFWEEVIVGLKITYSNLVGGPFQVGEEIRAAVPADIFSIGTITEATGSVLTLDIMHNDFVDGSVITGQTSGATAVVDNSNTASDISFDYDKAAVRLVCGVGATDVAIRQTHRYFAYVPGKSQLIFLTFVMGAAKVNVIRRVGYFDDLNGIFLEQTETETAFVIRTSTSGVFSDAERITQQNWSRDKLDGTGPSGITLDLTKFQIFVVDFQWLGGGRVRFGFNINGKFIIAHEENHANTDSVVYMRTSTLPVRFEIRNAGITSGNSLLEEICSSISSEGGYVLPGIEFSVSNGVTERSVDTTLQPILAIRLKNEFPAGRLNRRIVKFLNASMFVSGNDVHVRISRVHAAVDITAAWQDMGSDSAVEFSQNITAVTGRPLTFFEEAYVAGGVGQAGASGIVSGEFIGLHSFIGQNFNSNNSELFVIFAHALTGTADVLAHISWIEFN